MHSLSLIGSLILSLLLCLNAYGQNKTVPETYLTLLGSYTYGNMPKGRLPEFSGLAIWNGKLVAIDQKDAYYEIDVKGSTFTATKRDMGPKAESDKADFEGITVNPNDSKSFYFINEHDCNIYRFTPSSTSLEAVTTKGCDMYNDAGFKTTGNSSIEGIAWVRDNVFLLAWEKRNRGLILVEVKNGQVNILNSFIDKGGNSQALKYLADDEKKYADDCFTDVQVYNNTAYVLDREQECIYVVDFNAKPMQVKAVWELSVNANTKRFPNKHKGTVEGLALNPAEGCLYVILDAEMKHEKLAETPILYQFQLPKGF